MRGFVASAFGHDDVDAIYDRAIVPVLRELGLTPLRVDRHEHNEDIDDKIFELLDAADLCIADLTYARPSVYYEAGYAFARGTPVVYIARADHFRPRVGDPVGNLRVHFDLQMKNIIAWTSPNDTFRKQLKARLRHVTAPLMRARDADKAEREMIRAFEGRSLVDRVQAVLDKAEEALRSQGFDPVDGAKPWNPSPSAAAQLLRRADGEVQQITVAAISSLTAKTLRAATTSPWAHMRIWRPLTPSGPGWGKPWRCFLVLYSFNRLAASTIQQVLADCERVGNNVFQQSFEGAEVGSKDSEHTATVIVVEGVKYPTEAVGRSLESLDSLGIRAIRRSKNHRIKRPRHKSKR
jgi:nucleoside 2-deoxyribosyltransferase